MNKNKKVLTLLIASATVLTLASCGGKKEPTSSEISSTTSTNTDTSSHAADTYKFTYDLNYEGSTPKEVNVKAGTRATNWNATRSGYTLKGWYLDKACSADKKYDFKNYVNEDTTVYACWEKNAEQLKVYFDFNYEDADEAQEVTVEENTVISKALVPTSPRLGMVIEGWYKEKECKTKWDFDVDVVTEGMTLYAKYELDPSVPRDEDGSIKFENVNVGLFCGADFGNYTALQTLATKFNSLNSGKIKIITTKDLAGNQDAYALRMQQTPVVNETYTNYYKVSDVYSLAGISLDKDNWYANAIKENYVEGSMYSVPLLGGVPYLIYNKSLMSKYNEGELPSTFDEFKALLKKAYDGEVVTKSEFKSIITNRSWTFKECAASAAFFQNDAPYYEYTDEGYRNTWDDGSKTLDNAKEAMHNFYDIFGKEGACNGAASGSSNEYYDDTAIKAVNEGNSLMGLINIPGSANAYTGNTSIGYLPLSGLFANSDKTNYKATPYHQIGFEFYKAKNVSLVQLAAAAKFVDYCSENSMSFANNGWVPLRKSVLESEAYKNSSNGYVSILRQTVNPESMISFDGYRSEKEIYNKIAAEGILVPVFDLDKYSITSATMVEELDVYVEALRAAVSAQL